MARSVEKNILVLGLIEQGSIAGVGSGRSRSNHRSTEIWSMRSTEDVSVCGGAMVVMSHAIIGYEDCTLFNEHQDGSKASRMRRK